MLTITSAGQYFTTGQSHKTRGKNVKFGNKETSMSLLANRKYKRNYKQVNLARKLNKRSKCKNQLYLYILAQLEN